MVHPDTELRFVNDHIGWGVFATRALPKGTIVWALDPLDQKFTAAHVAALPAHAQSALEKYSYIDARGRHILCWDHGRFFNHSCAANCLSLGYDFELAVRDIAAGEELTDDYGTLNPLAPFPCLCGARCNPTTSPAWATAGTAAPATPFFLIPTVAQPLWHVLEERADIEAALADPNRVRPIQSHYQARRSVPVLAGR
jgi:hypothetical protein